MQDGHFPTIISGGIYRLQFIFFLVEHNQDVLIFKSTGIFRMIPKSFALH